MNRSKVPTTGISIAVLLVCAVLAAGCGRDAGRSDRAAHAIAERDFDSFRSFLEADDLPRDRRQVVVIGIDGATWTWLDRMIDDGDLPNFERIRREGAWGDLASVDCYVSPPAWTSMNTGYSPQRTGIYTFGRWDSEAGEFGSVRSTDVEVPAVWDIASAAGKRVGVVNVPMTFPVHPVDGVMVSGLMTPVTIDPPIAVRHSEHFAGVRFEDVAPTKVRAYSRPKKTVAMDSLNTLMWFRFDSRDDGAIDYDRVVLTVAGNDSARAGRVGGQTVVFDVGAYSPWLKIRAVHDGVEQDAWCKFILFKRNDGRYEARISQTFFDPREHGPFTHPPELADELMSRFGYYLPSKYLPYDIVDNAAHECARNAMYMYGYDDWDLFYYVFTQSDNIQHSQGMSAYTKKVYRVIDEFLGRLMDRLPAGSTLVVVSDHGFGRFELGVDLNEYLEARGLLFRRGDSNDVDYDRSLVFHNMWNLYFNHDMLDRRTLEAHGVTVAPGQDGADALATHLTALCAELRTTAGNRLPVALTRFDGGRGEDDPDMIVQGTYDGYLVEFWNIARARDGVVWRLLESEQHQHRREGVLMAWGDGIRRGARVDGARAVDVAPTLLYLLELPAAEDMDGALIDAMLQPDLLASHPLYEVPDLADVELERPPAPPDNEPLEKKLRSLGYVQ